MNLMLQQFRSLSRVNRFTETASCSTVALVLVFGALPIHSKQSLAQSVCLPAPRLLTAVPMGGQVGTEFDVVVSGQSLEGTEQLVFSNPSIVATPKVKDDGSVIANQFSVRIADDCPVGVFDARIMAALGISSARAFSVSDVPEQTQSKPCTSLESAMEMSVGSIVNATLVDRAVNFYSFDAKQGQRIVVDCAAKGIDSKMNPVLVVADSSGNDLIVQRRGGIIDFTIPEDGRYVVKVHDLTFKGGAYYFYRLAVTEVDPHATPVRLPSTKSVASFSWPPNNISEVSHFSDLTNDAASEPSDGESVGVTLPCKIDGTFYPAADVDHFEFQAKKGEVWWIEVASERIGCATDPSVVVQHLKGDGAITDVVELADIPTPVKRSTNGYSYDGPPYNAGSSDPLGKLEIPEDGTYRIRITDLFGGTRSDPANRYQMIVRKADPDFALVGWGLHMGLRNGDRNALSKPISLRGGAVMPIEIVAFRRDGFDGEINLTMDHLPEGVTATGLKIAAGKTRGIMLLSAQDNAPRGLEIASLSGSAIIDGEQVTRHCQLASMKWPVTNARNEIPDPRLVDQIPVSVGGVEQAGLSIAAGGDQSGNGSAGRGKVWQCEAGTKLTIPLKLTRRGEFSGKTMSLQTFGAGLERAAKFDLSLVQDRSNAVLDLAKLKTPPGDYTVAFYGGAVAKHSVGKAKPKDIVDIYVSEPIHIRVTPKEAKAK